MLYHNEEIKLERGRHGIMKKGDLPQMSGEGNLESGSPPRENV